MNLNKEFAILASEQRINKVAEALEAKGYDVQVVDTAAAAKAAALNLLSEGEEVFTLQSATAKAIGLTEAIDDSGQYKSIRKQLEELGQKPSREKARLGSAPEVAVGSVHAITEDGVLMIASNTGSQLAADASGAGKVIFVVGSQKLVKDLDEGFKRIYEYSLELEQERIEELFPGFKTAANKILIINREGTPGRIHIVLVKQNLGF